MSHQVLARKWRPKNFESLVGQEHVVRALTHALTTQRLHHAYLFTGTRGVVNTTLSRILAKSLNCETGITASPCGICRSCMDIDNGRFVDYVEMDAASNRGVDEMAAVLDNAMYAPTVGRYKVYVIDEVHMLSNHAFNAMLKTLEEPPPHVCFVLATTDPQKVPVTVLSRCMQFNLRNLAPQTIAERLTYVLQQEQITFDDACLMRLGRAASGSMRDALSLLDQAIAFGGGSVSDTVVMQMLGLVDSVFVQHILESLQAADGSRMVALADELLASGGAFEQVLLDLARELQQLAMAQQGLGEHSEQRVALAEALGPQALQVYYQIAIHGVKDLPLAPDAHTGFTMTLLRLLAFVPAGSPEARPATKQPNSAAPTVRPSLKSALVKPSVPVAARALINSPSNPSSNSPVPSLSAPDKQEPAALSTPPLVASGSDTALASPTEEAPSFNGDWPNLARQVRLNGFALQFMQQSQLISYEFNNPGYLFKVKVPIKILAESANVNKVKDALTSFFAQPVRVVVEVGTVQADTAAHLVASEKAQAVATAEAAIENDFFVQGLQKEFGATIVPGSIAPLPQTLKP